MSLIDAVRSGNLSAVTARLAAGEDPAARDDNGWNALDWAAGAGDPAIVSAVLGAGADPTEVGPEQRRPYEIAVAAGRLDAAALLAAAEDERSPDAAAQRLWRPYCRAYELAELRRFPGWAEHARPTEDDIAFVHDDLTVTGSVWHGEDVVFDQVDEAWTAFCHGELGFRVPRDIDLVTGTGAGTAS